MVVVPVIGPHLVKPASIIAGLAVQRLLDGGVDEDALDHRVPGGRLYDLRMRRRPQLGIDVLAVGGDHHGRRHLLALPPAELAIGHRSKPDVGVEADLMAVVAGEHRAAAGLRQVADQEPAPADLWRLLGQPFEELHQVRMAPVAIARQAHHLPGLAVDRQRLGAGETTLGIEADDARLQRRRLWLSLRRDCGVPGDVSIGEPDLPMVNAQIAPSSKPRPWPSLASSIERLCVRHATTLNNA
jgi:hypothetical protein